MQFRVQVQSNLLIAPDIHELTLASHKAMAGAHPGQFVHIVTNSALDPLLRRPMSICRYRFDDTWSVIFRVKGIGTQALALTQPGTDLDVLGPLGRGFRLPEPGLQPVLVGGGVGVPPLLFLAYELCRYGLQPAVFLGFASRNDAICLEAFAKLGLAVRVATDDGSLGYRGLVTDLLPGLTNSASVYSCGPVGMLQAVALLCRERGVDCQVSLEERMACGVGACLSCVCPVRLDGAEQWVWQRVCKEGPVFDGAEVAFDVMCQGLP